MSLGIRGFVEFLVAEINKEGVLGNGYSDNERLSDVIDMIWKAYDDFKE